VNVICKRQAYKNLGILFPFFGTPTLNRPKNVLFKYGIQILLFLKYGAFGAFIPKKILLPFTPNFFLCHSHNEWVNQVAQMIGLLISPSFKAFGKLTQCSSLIDNIFIVCTYYKQVLGIGDLFLQVRMSDKRILTS
jgi:hypothetical protein